MGKMKRRLLIGGCVGLLLLIHPCSGSDYFNGENSSVKINLDSYVYPEMPYEVDNSVDGKYERGRRQTVAVPFMENDNLEWYETEFEKVIIPEYKKSKGIAKPGESEYDGGPRTPSGFATVPPFNIKKYGEKTN